MEWVNAISGLQKHPAAVIQKAGQTSSFGYANLLEPFDHIRIKSERCLVDGCVCHFTFSDIVVCTIDISALDTI